MVSESHLIHSDATYMKKIVRTRSFLGFHLQSEVQEVPEDWRQSRFVLDTWSSVLGDQI